MDWLKDKKNQPYVALILAVLILGAAALVYFQMKGSGPDMPTTAMTPQQPPADGAPMDTTAPPDAGAPVDMGAPADTGAPADAASTPAPGEQTVASTPMETWRNDPFQPIGYKPPPKQVHRPKPRIIDFPFVRLPKPPAEVPPEDLPEPVQPVRRMAGILLNDRVYAIIESNGQSQIVQPGDVLADRLATVERIEPDKVVLKTMTEKPRYLVVRMASSPRANETYSSGSSSSGPGPGPGPRPRLPMDGPLPTPAPPSPM